MWRKVDFPPNAQLLSKLRLGAAALLWVGLGAAAWMRQLHGATRQGIHCMPRTSDLNEELGQVEYVFSEAGRSCERVSQILNQFAPDLSTR